MGLVTTARCSPEHLKPAELQMSTSQDKLTSAQWIFERTLGWIAAAEIKVGAITAIDLAMLTALGAFFSAEPSKNPWAIFFGASAAGGLFIALFCTAMVLSPRLKDGPKESLIFFGAIASIPRADYVMKLETVSEQDILKDIAAQIHRNAEIAQKKHEYVKKCLFWSLFSVIPWISTVGLLVKY